jgi:hypothetical protein
MRIRFSVHTAADVYERLGYFGPKRKTKSGKIINGYLKPFNGKSSDRITRATFRHPHAAPQKL